MTRQALVSCRQVCSSVPAHPSPWLAALPWPSPSGPARHLLLIHQLPFYLVHPLTFSRIQMICRWTAQFMNWRGLHGTDSPTAGPLLVSPALLRQATTDAAAMHREHGLPSASLSFRLAPGFTEEQAARLTLLVSPQLRATDLAAPHPDGSLDVLLTFDGPTEALRFQQRILALAARDPLLQGCLDLGTTFAPPERAAA